MNPTEIALKKLTEEFDKFIQACIEAYPSAPDTKDLTRARACIPKGYKTSFHKENP